jgi:hypothetical protein
MNCRALGNWWKGFFGKKTASMSQTPVRLPFAPLSVGLRVDVSLSTGTGRLTNASQFVWISPVGSDPRGRALEVLLTPN